MGLTNSLGRTNSRGHLPRAGARSGDISIGVHKLQRDAENCTLPKSLQCGAQTWLAPWRYRDAATVSPGLEPPAVRQDLGGSLKGLRFEW